jgi:hypothetical protein
MSHTPGPWEWNREETAMQEFRGYSVDYPSDAYGPGTRLVLIPPEVLQNEDDARLVAAAPDLLAALEKVDALTQAPSQVDPLMAEIHAAARAAIAKANGDQTRGGNEGR